MLVGVAVVLTLSSVAWAGPPEEPPTGDPWCREFQGEFPWLCGELAPVPATGQTLCYDEDGVELPSCEGTGQDGEYQMGVEWPVPRFTDNENGTVTDNLTGLIWLRDANCMLTEYPDFDTDYNIDGRVTWQHALDFVAGMNDGTYEECAAGREDWRLPNVRELFSLVHHGFYDPAVPNTDGDGLWIEGDPFSGVQSAYYWSSTTNADSTPIAWLVFFFDGHVNYGYKGSYYFVWPVRGGQ